MAIIRDQGELSIGVLALAVSWGLRTTCYVQGCDQPITTICTDHAEPFCLCETHYQQANVPGGTRLTIVFGGPEQEAES